MKKFRIEFRWAIIFSMFTLLWMYFEKSMGWHDELISKQAAYTNLIAIPYLIIFTIALINKREKDFNGVMSWKQGLISGTIISAFIAVLSPIVQFVISDYITPDYFHHIITYSVESGRMSQKGAEAYYNFNSYLIQGIFFSLAMGIVTSAIVSIFVKKEPK
ncbi:DUF4199 domain-containing protein [Mesonia aestuariivivens]|uniref:DUF4199 domain-containing protein n=1 Tax=Mesonia aestuariivivens TaxID=2796128 RepID=A0ABS6W417_9FLAO|nr:DUF4199 domain-containing protein [Mesonia aestuariivivens]MBW2962600.1 DUF4199 domain-containing protein [Mesonia aestuariivivens]